MNDGIKHYAQQLYRQGIADRGPAGSCSKVLTRHQVMMGYKWIEEHGKDFLDQVAGEYVRLLGC